MAKPQIRLDRKGMRALLRSQGVTEDLGKRARRVADRANSESGTTGYVASTYAGKNRARGTVITSDLDSTLDNARENRLVRSLDAARDA